MSPLIEDALGGTSPMPTERVNCQVCGRYCVPRKDGNVPKHGDCPGADHAPAPAHDVAGPLYAAALATGDVEACSKWGRRMAFNLGVTVETCQLEDFLRKFSHVLWLVQATEKYGKCRCCGKELNPEQYAWAKRRFEPQLCGDPECARKDHIKRNACCEKATPIPCVCMHSFSCPDHGTMHVGTHD